MIRLPEDVVLIEHKTATGSYRRLCRKRHVYPRFRGRIIASPETYSIVKVLEWLDDESGDRVTSVVYGSIAATIGHDAAVSVLQLIVDSGGLSAMSRKLEEM